MSALLRDPLNYRLSVHDTANISSFKCFMFPFFTLIAAVERATNMKGKRNSPINNFPEKICHLFRQKKRDFGNEDVVKKEGDGSKEHVCFKPAYHTTHQGGTAQTENRKSVNKKKQPKGQEKVENEGKKRKHHAKCWIRLVNHVDFDVTTTEKPLYLHEVSRYYPSGTSSILVSEKENGEQGSNHQPDISQKLDEKGDQIPSSYPARSKQFKSSNDREIRPESLKDKDAEGDDLFVHQLASVPSKNSSPPASQLEGTNGKGQRYRRGKGLEELTMSPLPPDANAYDMTGILFKRRTGICGLLGWKPSFFTLYRGSLCYYGAGSDLDARCRPRWERGTSFVHSDQRNVQGSTRR